MTIVFGGLCWDPPVLGKYHMRCGVSDLLCGVWGMKFRVLEFRMCEDWDLDASADFSYWHLGNVCLGEVEAGFRDSSVGCLRGSAGGNVGTLHTGG